MSNLQVLTSQILYDRIINVTLIRDTVITKYGMYSDVEYNPDTGTKLTGRQNDTRILLAGFSHYEFKTNDMNIVERELVQATGQTWKYDFSDPVEEEMFHNGRSTTGVKLAIGDRIIVDNNGQQIRYHVAEAKDNDEGYAIQETLDIVCPDQGIKPSISFSVNVIPGQHCYGLDLRISNMNLDIPVRQFNRLKVTAGYRSGGGLTSFDCTVFSSYIEQANPDGIVVFRCITCGETNAFLRSNPIRVNYKGGISTIHDLIVGVCALLSVTPYDYLDGKYKYATLRMEIRGTRADNALALLDWMRGIIVQVIRSLEGGSPDVPIQDDPQPVAELTSDGLYVYCVNRPNTDVTPEGKAAADSGYTIIDMDAVKGATFNGVALTVQSVWNPLIKPGRVFRMMPNIINGANLPNEMSASTYGADSSSATGNLYRVLTQTINFSTNGKENEMTLLAVPVKYLEAYTTEESVNLTFNEWIYRKQQLENGDTYEQVLNIGQAEETVEDETDEQARKKEQDTNSRKMFNIDPFTSGGVREGKTVLVQDGDTLSGLALAWYRETAPDGGKYILKPIDCDKRLLEGTTYIGAIHPVNIWPVIAVATYRKYVKDKGLSSNKWSSFSDLTNPNLIHKGEQVYIPKIEDMDQLAGMKDIFIYAYNAYKNIPGYDGWARRWLTIYEYLRTYS